MIIEPKEFGMTRDELMEKLKEYGIDSRAFFVGLHKQPALKEYGCSFQEEYPISNWLSENGLYLPSGSGLTEEEIKKICDIIKRMHQNENNFPKV